MNKMTTYLNKGPAHWLKLLRDEDPFQRRLGAYALGQIGPDAGDAADALVKALQDDQSFVRVWVAAALARIDPNNEDAVEILCQSTKDELGFVRSLAAWHLGRIGPELPSIERSIPTIQALLEDHDPSVRTEAELALKRLRARAR